MKISEITVSDVAAYLRLATGDYDATVIAAIMAAAKKFIIDYTGIPETDETSSTIDDYPDFYIAYMSLCADMYDNRSMYYDNGLKNKSQINKTVETVLNMHSLNLL